MATQWCYGVASLKLKRRRGRGENSTTFLMIKRHCRAISLRVEAWQDRCIDSLVSAVIPSCSWLAIVATTLVSRQLYSHSSFDGRKTDYNAYLSSCQMQIYTLIVYSSSNHEYWALPQDSLVEISARETDHFSAAREKPLHGKIRKYIIILELLQCRLMIL